jgi:hypothetical protein
LEVFVDELFELSHGELSFNNKIAEETLFFFAGESEECPRVSGGKSSVLDTLLDVGREFEQAKGVSDSRPTFFDSLGNFFLAKTEALHEDGVGTRFFDGVEIFALEIFDESVFKLFAFGGVDNESGDDLESGFLSGAPAAFASDENPGIVFPSYKDGLE